MLRLTMAILAFVTLIFSEPVHAGAKYLKEDFSFADEPQPTVLVVRPDIFVGSLDGSGRQVMVPDWLHATHINLQGALKRHPMAEHLQLKFADWNDPSSTPLSRELWAALGGLNSDMLTKAPQGTFPIEEGKDWQKVLKSVERKYHEYYLPEAMRDEVIASEGAADYALFIYMHDAYSTNGAMLGRLLGGMSNVIQDGVNTDPGPPHHGYSILADLRNGAVIWYYNDGRFGGDLRKGKSADKRVRQMLKKFPAE